MSKPSISLCMIVKNEEDLIESCLQSIHELVDELIIVDTGSTDQTVTICKQFHAKIYPFKWNHHFADARNFGLSKARGDWILWMDADEKLQPGNHSLILEALSNTDATIFFMPIINYSNKTLPVKDNQAYLYYQPRIFKNQLGIQFINRIHETLKLPQHDELQYKKAYLESPILHYGYIDEIKERKHKSERNLHILLEEYKNPNHSPWIEYHLASEYYRKSDYQTAFNFVNKSILNFILQGLMPPAIVYRLKYGILIETNNFDGALSGIDHALLLYPDYVDLHFIKGLILFRKNMYSDALKSFETCLELGEHHKEYLILKGVGSFRALHYKQLCLEKLNTRSK